MIDLKVYRTKIKILTTLKISLKACLKLKQYSQNVECFYIYNDAEEAIGDQNALSINVHVVQHMKKTT